MTKNRSKRTSQRIAKIKLKQWSLNQIRHCLTEHIQMWHHFFDQLLKYFHDFQDQNFSVLWLRWTQTMETKQNQTLFHGKYSNMTSCLFYQRTLKYFNVFSKSKFLSFMTKMNPNNGNEFKIKHFYMGHIQI